MRLLSGSVCLPAAMALAGALALSARAADFADAYQKSLGAVVYISATDRNWETSHGSGVIVDAKLGYVLTAYHVVGQDRLVSAHDPAYDKEGKLITDVEEYFDFCEDSECLVIASDPKRDLALLKFKHPRTGLKSIPIAQSSARPGQEVFTIGNDAEASMWHFAAGNTRQVHHAEQLFQSGQRVSAAVIEVTTPLNSGDSGGPLLNGAGELVGINSSVTRDANQVNTGIDVTEIRSFLGDAYQALASKKDAR